MFLTPQYLIVVMGLSPGLAISVQDLRTSVKQNFGVKPYVDGKKIGADMYVKELRYRISKMLKYVNYSLPDLFSRNITSPNDQVIVPV